MLDGQELNLRQRLRVETAKNHRRVDMLFSTLELTEPKPLGIFLAAHHAGFLAALNAIGDKQISVGQALLEEMVNALDRDLNHLGRNAPMIEVEPVCSEAIDHIVLGSRLGTAVLRKQWSASTNPKVLSASHYFSLPSHTSVWRAHTEKLSEMPANSVLADAIIEDTRSLYRLFERAFHGVS